MRNTTATIFKGRCKQVGGRLCKLWGRFTRNGRREFIGDLIIVEGKLEEFYASRHPAQASPRTGLAARRPTLNVVA